MPIYICKNCGNLTETEESGNLFCSTCGASLGPPKPQETTGQPQAPGDLPRQPSVPPTTRAPIPPPVQSSISTPTRSAVTPPTQPVSPPTTSGQQKEVSLESTEIKEPATSPESPVPRTPPQQTEIALDSSSTATAESVSSSESAPGETSPEQIQVGLEETPSVMEVYEDKDLVVCPQCSYGCNAAWDKCPICGTEIAGNPELKKISETDFTIDEKDLQENLKPCPKCNYYCDPSWDSCPICQTKLKESE